MSKDAVAPKRGKTFEQRFLNELARQCGDQDIAILNRVLRQQLGWMDERFDQVRRDLIKKGTIKAAPGQGGKTKFAAFKPHEPAKKALKAFISYAHGDEALKDRLLAHLKPLERLGLVDSWHDRRIRPGDDFAKAIDGALDEASLIFLLVSVDFINSNYCYDIELGRAMERMGPGVKILPIILRQCLWNHTPFGGLLAMPKDGKAVLSFEDPDEAFTEIAISVRDMAREMLAT